MVTRIEFQDQINNVSPEIEELTVKSTISAEVVKSLINSVASNFEERLLLQDSIDGIGREAGAFISYLYSMT